MSDTLDKIKTQFAERQKTRAAYIKEAIPGLQRYYREDRKRGKHPDEFKDTSFLYIRSYDGDMGARPFSGITHWRSPDLNLIPVNGPQAYTTTIEAGQTYTIRTVVRNLGDIMVPFPKVEFFLTDPTIGFDTRFADLLGVTQYNGLLLAGQNGTVDFLHTVDPKQSGHKCLFARTWSFSPPDLPFDLNALDPRIDRHIAQQNLNIIGQSQALTFQLIHLPLTDEQIALMPLTRDEVMMTRHPLLADFKIRGQLPAGAMRKIEMKVMDTKQEVQLERTRTGYAFQSRGDGPGLREQAAIYHDLEASLAAVTKGRGNRQAMQAARKAYREMNRMMQRSWFTLRIPDLGLEKGEAAAFDIVGTRTVNGQVKGGITVVVTG